MSTLKVDFVSGGASHSPVQPQARHFTRCLNMSPSVPTAHSEVAAVTPNAAATRLRLGLLAKVDLVGYFLLTVAIDARALALLLAPLDGVCHAAKHEDHRDWQEVPEGTWDCLEPLRRPGILWVKGRRPSDHCPI